MRNTLIGFLLFIILVMGVGFSTTSTLSTPDVQRSPIIAQANLTRTPASVSDSSSAVYRLSRSLSADLAGEKWMDIHYEGDLFVSRSSADAQTTWIELRFKMDGENKISVPLTAQIGGDGKVLELLAPKADSSEMTQEISILKDLLAVFIFRNNEDTVGRYEAVYTDFSGGIRKEKTKYISYGSTHVPKVDIIFSKHEWTASADPYFPRTIAGEEKTGSDTNQGLLTYSQYRLVRKVDPPILPKLLSLHPTQKTTFSLTEAKIKPSIHWEESIERPLQAWGELDSQGQLRLFRKLNVALQSDSSLVPRLIHWMKSRAHDPEAQALGVGVLATVGSDAAQKALLELYEKSEELRQTILGALTTTEAPLSSVTQSFLHQKAQEVETQPGIALGAAFALGASLKKIPDPAIEQSLLDLWAVAPTPDTKQAYLDAMGNSGNARFLPIIEEALASSDITTREKAVFALRWMDDSRAQDILEQASHDSNPRIQAQATLARRFLAP